MCELEREVIDYCTCTSYSLKLLYNKWLLTIVIFLIIIASKSSFLCQAFTTGRLSLINILCK